MKPYKILNMKACSLDRAAIENIFIKSISLHPHSVTDKGTDTKNTTNGIKKINSLVI